jgi:DNA-binding beta-propeller fold protein YncE
MAAEFVFTTDWSASKVTKFDANDLSYISEIGSPGSGNDNFSGPTFACCDDTYIYISDSGNNRIVKRLVSDLSYQSQVTIFNGLDTFNQPLGICHDGTNLYIADSLNDRIIKLLKSDFSYVDEFQFSGISYVHPVGLAYDTINDVLIVTVDADAGPDRDMYSIDGTDFSTFIEEAIQVTGIPYGCDVNSANEYVYYCDVSGEVVPGIYVIEEFDLATIIDSYVGGPGDPPNFNAPFDIKYDGTYLYVTNFISGYLDKRLASDLSDIMSVDLGGFGNIYGVALYISAPPPPAVERTQGVIIG